MSNESEFNAPNLIEPVVTFFTVESNYNFTDHNCGELAYICNPTTVQLLIGWFFLCILLTMMKVWNVANTAHGAGFIFGYLLGQSIFTIRRRALWRAATVVAAVAMLGTLLWCPWHAGFQLMKRHPAPYRPLLQRAVEPAGYVAEATLAERADPGSAPHSQQRGGPD